jgi:hypothetical protein
MVSAASNPVSAVFVFAIVRLLFGGGPRRRDRLMLHRNKFYMQCSIGEVKGLDAGSKSQRGDDLLTVRKRPKVMIYLDLALRGEPQFGLICGGGRQT